MKVSDTITHVFFGETCYENEEVIQNIGQRLEELAKEQHPIILDFSRVEQMPAKLMGKLVTFYKGMKEVDQPHTFLGLRHDIWEIFRITRLDLLFSRATTLNEAIAALTPPPA